ncbi:FAD-dependent oxidoreductase [Eisenibacter elegans]|jgi:sulfide:quinone oxidoreductase|uniref:FAD-dependent oxidoreductase n=1 Tax=Eisenibacter elegans TaxID=997 RepID=UPI000419E1E5
MHYQILIIGGGTAGIMVASQLLKANKALSLAIVEPSETHYYQPAWTLVGAGAYDMGKTARPMKSLIPTGATWIQDYAAAFEPEQNAVKLRSGEAITYDYLVVAPGLVMAPELIEGLPEALDKGVVCSNYTNPEHTWQVIRNFKGGNAVFTQPTTPIKCGGAPQKIAYLAADYFRKNGLSAKSNVVFATPGSVIFGVKIIADTLMQVVHRYNIHFKPFYAPVKIDSNNQTITFRSVAPDENHCIVNEGNVLKEQLVGSSEIVMPFDMLHLAPPQVAPSFVKESALVNEAGWLDVDQGTLQHKRYPNIFGLGDVAGLPTAKTGAAIRKQAPVVVQNLLRLMRSQGLSNKVYDGYSSCPLVTGYGKMVLAEFDYQGNFTPDPKLKQMLVFNSHKEHWRLWMLKKHMLPYLYWNKMMKGQDV